MDTGHGSRSSAASPDGHTRPQADAVNGLAAAKHPFNDLQTGHEHSDLTAHRLRTEPEAVPHANGDMQASAEPQRRKAADRPSSQAASSRDAAGSIATQVSAADSSLPRCAGPAVSGGEGTSHFTALKPASLVVGPDATLSTEAKHAARPDGQSQQLAARASTAGDTPERGGVPVPAASSIAAPSQHEPAAPLLSSESEGVQAAHSDPRRGGHAVDQPPLPNGLGAAGHSPASADDGDQNQGPAALLGSEHLTTDDRAALAALDDQPSSPPPRPHGLLSLAGASLKSPSLHEVSMTLLHQMPMLQPSGTPATSHSKAAPCQSPNLTIRHCLYRCTGFAAKGVFQRLELASGCMRFPVVSMRSSCARGCHLRSRD